MQRKLRRLAHRADEQGRCRSTVISIQSVPANSDRLPPVRPLGEHFVVVQRTEICASIRPMPRDEAEVADAVDQKGLQVGENRRRPVVPEADQQIGHQAHRFPAEEQLQEVVAHHQHQHREGEQRDIGKKRCSLVVLFHVADGVDMHHQRHKGDDQHHHRGQRIDQEADLQRDAAGLQPRIDRAVVDIAAHHVHVASCTDATNDTSTPRMVAPCAACGNWLPNSLVPQRPAMIAPASGASGTISVEGLHGHPGYFFIP